MFLWKLAILHHLLSIRREALAPVVILFCVQSGRRGSSFPLNVFESLLKKLQKSASELYRVHYLRYLNNFYHDDYPGALENLHRYFDYRLKPHNRVNLILDGREEQRGKISIQEN